MSLRVGRTFTTPLLELEPQSSDLPSVIAHVQHVVIMCLWSDRNYRALSRRSEGSVMSYAVFNNTISTAETEKKAAKAQQKAVES
jgi:hypothetical protein